MKKIVSLAAAVLIAASCFGGYHHRGYGHYGRPAPYHSYRHHHHYHHHGWVAPTMFGLGVIAGSVFAPPPRPVVVAPQPVVVPAPVVVSPAPVVVPPPPPRVFVYP